MVPITTGAPLVTATPAQVLINFAGAELVGVDLGDVGSGGTNWLINTAATPDHTFTLMVQVSPVPEPSSLVLLGLGAAGALGYGWRQRKSAGRS